MTAKERRRIARVGWLAGARYNFNIIDACVAAGVPISLGYAIVEQESGFRNVFGHDPTSSIPQKWQGKRVTKRRYEHYKRMRPSHGMQGVGPAQITWYEYQNEADARGGCWIPGNSIWVGMRVLSANILRLGKHGGVAAYNGAGPDADRYANQVLARADHWHRVLTK